MNAGKSQNVGAAGQYYVAYCLSLRNLCASLTIGNSIGVDILVSNDGGLNSLAVQVKTSRNAFRNNRYGNSGFEWDVGKSVIDKQSLSFWYAFVDLQEERGTWTPQVFIVPSKWVAEFVKADWGRFMYFLPERAESLCLDRWDNLVGSLNGSEEVGQFASIWPESVLVRWGNQD